MESLDEWIARAADGGSLAVVLLVGVLLGPRHSTNRDHLTADSSPTAGMAPPARGRSAGLPRRKRRHAVRVRDADCALRGRAASPVIPAARAALRRTARQLWMLTVWRHDPQSSG
jgi:hypothetical protein